MRVAKLIAPERFDLVEEPDPAIAPDEVLLHVAACGVCASELDIYRGLAGHADYPWYPGHEVSGTVERAGPEAGFSLGEPVAAWVTARGFADRIAVRAEYCFPAGGVPLDVALGEPLACALNAVELAAPSLGDDVVVIGAGFMGNLVQKLVGLRGPRHLVVADMRAEALERAASLGATHTVNVGERSLEEAVSDLTDGRGADVAFEVTGVQPGLDLLGRVVRMSGTAAIVGYHQGAARSIDLAMWNWMAFRVVNAHFRDVATILRGMQRGMRLLTSGRIAIDDLVTDRFPLDQIDKAFRTAVEKPPGFVKATVIP
ncbi:MAG: zinc-binding dehydrogenase [Actinobacteria bacterium]|nr:MAG: zinc-binding dehydrogenase [Actinomycetota bacterium]